MKRLFDYADKYLKKSNWKDIGLIKGCVFSVGIFVGTYIPKKNIEYVRVVALIAFVATAVFILKKFIKIIMDKGK